MVHFRASFLKHFQRECHVFSPQTFATEQSRDKSQDRGEQSKGLEAVSQILHGWSRRFTQVGWSSAPRSCSQAAGCDTPGRRPGLSRPDWSPERGPWVGTSPSPSHSAQTLYSYSLPSSWKTHRDRKWLQQCNITTLRLPSHNPTQLKIHQKQSHQQQFRVLLFIIYSKTKISPSSLMITTHKYIKSKLKIGNYPDDRIVIFFKECQMFSVFRVSKQLVVLSVLCHCKIHILWVGWTKHGIWRRHFRLLTFLCSWEQRHSNVSG